MKKCFLTFCEGKEVMTTYLYITDCTAPLRTIVIKLLDSGKLIGIIPNIEKTPEEQIIHSTGPQK